MIALAIDDATVGMKQKVRVLIVEDEYITLSLLKDELEDAGYYIAGDAMNADEAIAVLDQNETDIAILDINLKGSKSGIWVAQKIQQQYNIPFIFLSAYSDRQTVALAADTRPASYLVKPFTQADLFTSIELALHNYAKQQIDNTPEQTEANVPNNAVFNETIFVKEEHSYRKITINDILYAEAFKNYLEVQLTEGRVVIRSTLKDFLASLPENHFMQTHRSYIVNLKHVDQLLSNTLILGNKEVPVSRGFKNSVQERLGLAQ